VGAAVRRDGHGVKRITVRDVLEAVLDLREYVEAGFIRIEGRLDEHDRRFEGIDRRFDRTDATLERIEQRADRHEDRISALEERG